MTRSTSPAPAAAVAAAPTLRRVTLAPVGPPATPPRWRPADAADGEHGEAERLTAALVRWYLEALAGRRDVRQLRDLLTMSAERRVLAAVLADRSRRLAGDGRQRATARVRRVHVQPLGDRWEALALVDDGVRTTAVTAVLHRTATGWRVSDVARPEDGLEPLPAPALV